MGGEEPESQTSARLASLFSRELKGRVSVDSAVIGRRRGGSFLLGTDRILVSGRHCRVGERLVGGSHAHKMESKPSRIPRKLTVQPSGSRSARIGTGSGGTSLTDSYRTRESSFRLDSGWQVTSSPSLPASSWLGESERSQGAYSSRLHNQQQDIDSKRPKLSYTSTSSMRSNGLSTVSDSPWRYSDVPRSSSMVLGSLTTELVRERRELERTEPSVSFVDCSQRNDLQERPASSYAQGARPKENSLSSLRLNTSMNRQLPSEHESSLLSREHSWNSRSNYVPREVETSERNIQPEFTHDTMRSGTRTSNHSEGILPTQRSLSEPSADTEGRRSTRQLLSRLASSMSSTFFPRRSGQDSLTSSRSLGSRDISVLRAQASAQATTSNTLTTSEGTEAQTPGSGPQGFSFLRRRWGLQGISPNPNTESEPGNYRHHSESRNAGIDVHLCFQEGEEKEEMKRQELLPLKHLLGHCIFLGEENLLGMYLLKHKGNPSGPGHQYLQYPAVLYLLLRGQSQCLLEEIQEYQECFPALFSVCNATNFGK
ncbi:hypothetical protein E2320_020341 [Naja naja]|nr:hypothetical protein E2320_020341 [Naja naja]